MYREAVQKIAKNETKLGVIGFWLWIDLDTNQNPSNDGDISKIKSTEPMWLK
jgi:hypothetical protein